MHLENIAQMNNLQNGMDVIIVSTNSMRQKEFWEEHLNSTREFILKPNAKIIVIYEDWPGGAGNLLGTLYAFMMAQKEIDLMAIMAEGGSVAIYHTAGQGKRLWPLTGSEEGNKAAVKLPQIYYKQNKKLLITILESIIKQTSIYANSGQGRLSVFWGDQIFIPALAPPKNLTSHIVSFVMKIAIPEMNMWEQKKLGNYGIFMTKGDGNSLLSEKVDFETLQMLIGYYHARDKIGLNLGCFSLSLDILKLLLMEFEEELKSKKSRLDTDSHLWMPLTHDASIYTYLMQQKNVSEDESLTHFQRIAKLKQHIEGQLYAGVDIGSQSDWWDYGTIQSYYMNQMKLLQNDPEADRMRAFFQIVSVTNPLLIDCDIKQLNAKNSVLIGVKADMIDSIDSVLCDVQSPEIHATRSLLYHIHDDKTITSPENGVQADVQNPITHAKARFKTTLLRDGKEDWAIRLNGNGFSYCELAEHNIVEKV